MLYFLPLKFATTLYFTGFPGISHPLTDVPTHKYLFVIYSVKLHPYLLCPLFPHPNERSTTAAGNLQNIFSSYISHQTKSFSQILLTKNILSKIAAWFSIKGTCFCATNRLYIKTEAPTSE